MKQLISKLLNSAQVIVLPLCVALIYLLSTKVDAQQEPGRLLDLCHVDYPGRSAVSDRIIDITSVAVQQGVKNYFTVYGQWPENWAQVTSSGLWQVPVVGFNMEPVNPDDASLDFPSDLFYEAPGENNATGRIHQMPGFAGLQVSHRDIWTGESLQVSLTNLQESVGMNAGKYLGDPNWLKFLAIRDSVDMNIQLFKTIHGRYPQDGNEFLRSGLGPINNNSINPLTGDKFYFDGREFNFSYSLRSDTTGYEFLHTEEAGQRPEMSW